MSSFRKHVDKIQQRMFNANNIRNISVIAHVDHGKTTLTDSLLGAAGIISAKSVGNKLFTHTRQDEAEKGITIKSTSISLPFDYKNQQPVLVNLIDSPGHVDFSSEVTAALRVTDGALVVVDVVEGARTQTETVLRQALQEKVKPVLFVNKIDRAIVELQFTPEELYNQLFKIIESVNALIATYSEPDAEPIVLSPELGNVAFGAAKLGFGFTLTKFAEMYAAKSSVTVEKFRNRLWNDNFYDPSSKKWVKQAGDANLKRGFCQFVLDPIYKLFSICKEEVIVAEQANVMWQHLDKILPALNVKVSADDRKLNNKETLKTVMQNWLPAHEALLEMIVEHLPSPVQAQSYRYQLLYTGPLDDPYAEAIKKCDQNGPLILFVSKMVPMSDGSRFIAFGRVFSGSISTGGKVKIITSDQEVFYGPVHKTLLMMGRNSESVEQVPAGNVCGLVGIDKFIVKSCTITQENLKDVHPIKSMKYSVSPVVQVAVEPENPADMVKLVEGLKKMSKSDPLVQVTRSDSGQFVVAGAGELHLEIILGDLENEYCKGAKIKRSNPVVQFCETISEKSINCLAKSANKLNRIYMEAEPLSEELTLAIENNKIPNWSDMKVLQKALKDDFGWGMHETKKIWCFGPDTGSNALVDTTKGIDYLLDIQNDVVSSFKWASKHGVLCEETLRGVRFNILDASIHGDAAHRGTGQIMPAAKRVYNAAQLSGKPRLVEPVYQVDIQTSELHMGAVYNILNKKRGSVIATELNQGAMVTIKAHLPVLESFGLTELLRSATGGNAFPMCAFDHWQVIESDPKEASTRAHEIVKSVRMRKGLKPEIPQLAEYLDKL